MRGSSILTAGFLILLTSFVVTCIGNLLCLKVFPNFVSREKKSGIYRSEQLQGIALGSTKLPHLGGVGVLIGFTVSLVLGYRLGWTVASFRLFLVPVWGFALAGFVDDYRKTKGGGIPEKQKLAYIVGLSLALSLLFYFKFGFSVPSQPFIYISYFSVPVVWAAWFLFESATVTTVTTLSVGFSDGIDGLLAGLWLIASVAYAVFTTVHGAAIASAISFALMGAAAGFLLFNLPSGWSSGKPGSRRRARMYLGETGSMLVGSSFALLAILSESEHTWIIVGGVFVLEGASALYQAKILTPLFRRHMRLLRHMDDGSGNKFPHSEFPLPFLATPYHCHLDLLGLGRLRIVHLLWGLGIVLAVVGVSTTFVQELFGKAVLWFIGISLMVAFWVLGNKTKNVFLGFQRDQSGQDFLCINRGLPYEMFGRKVYWTEEVVEIRRVDFERFGFLLDVALWKPMSKSDALIAVGCLCSRIGSDTQALGYWGRVPESLFRARPQAFRMYLLAQQRSVAACEVDRRGHHTAMKEEDGLAVPCDGSNPGSTSGLQVGDER